MKQNDSCTSGLVLGTAQTSDIAQAVVGFFTKCPYCAIAASEATTVVAVLAFPSHRKWWFESSLKTQKVLSAWNKSKSSMRKT